MDLSQRATFLSTFQHHQVWSLPDSLIYHISKKPLSAKAYERVILSCKYFFVKERILVVERFSLEYTDNGWHSFFKGSRVDLTKVLSKIWITNGLTINCHNSSVQNLLSSFVKKIYHCDVKELNLYNQTIFFNDFKFLASKCEKIHFDDVTVINENGCIVALENLFGILVDVKICNFYIGDNAPNIITPTTVSKLLEIPHFSNLDYFILVDIPENFDINQFYDYIKKNKKTKIQLRFSNQHSETDKARLQAIVNEILADKNRSYKRPFIHYPGIDQSWIDLNQLYVHS